MTLVSSFKGTFKLAENFLKVLVWLTLVSMTRENPVLVDDFSVVIDRYFQIGRKCLQGSGVVDSSVNNLKNPVLVDDFSVVIDRYFQIGRFFLNYLFINLFIFFWKFL